MPGSLLPPDGSHTGHRGDRAGGGRDGDPFSDADLHPRCRGHHRGQGPVDSRSHGALSNLDAGPDGQSNQYADQHAYADSHFHQHADQHAHADPYTQSNQHANTHAYADSHPHQHANTHTHADPHAHSNSHPHQHANT